MSNRPIVSGRSRKTLRLPTLRLRRCRRGGLFRTRTPQLSGGHSPTGAAQGLTWVLGLAWLLGLTPAGQAAPGAVQSGLADEARPAARQPASADEPGFTPLFDGQTLKGWEGNLQWFRVHEQAVVAGSLARAIPRNEFLCTTRRYGDFELRLEVRLEGEGRNAGIQFRSERIPNHHEVRGYQCDVGEMNGKQIWGWLYDESRRRKMLVAAEDAQSQQAVKPGWNALVIRCQGPRIQIWLNGHRTVDYREADAQIPRTGIIGLQIHSGKPAEASYRRLRIKEL